MKTLLLTLLAFASVSAQAADSRCPHESTSNSTVTLRQYSMAVRAGATESVRLCRKLRVHKLYIQAEGYWHDAYAQVIVNGSVKGTLYVPGNDPHYVVTVEDETSSIEFAAIQSSFKVLSLKAVVSEAYGYAPSPVQPPQQFAMPVHTEMGKISARVIWLVNQLENYTNYKTYGQYLLPIRKAGAVALATAEARGDASLSARATYEDLLTTMDAAAPYISNAFEIDYALNLAVELMSKRELIRRLLE